jgi:hypothetical protein
MNYNYDATLLYFLFSNISILRMYLYHHYSNIRVPSLHAPSSLTMRSLRRYYLMKRKQAAVGALPIIARQTMQVRVSSTSQAPGNT